MKASLVSVALWEKLWGTRDMAQQVLQGEYLTGKQAGEEQNNMLKWDYPSTAACIPDRLVQAFPYDLFPRNCSAPVLVAQTIP